MPRGRQLVAESSSRHAVGQRVCRGPLDTHEACHGVLHERGLRQEQACVRLPHAGITHEDCCVDGISTPTSHRGAATQCTHGCMSCGLMLRAMYTVPHTRLLSASVAGGVHADLRQAGVAAAIELQLKRMPTSMRSGLQGQGTHAGAVAGVGRSSALVW